MYYIEYHSAAFAEINSQHKEGLNILELELLSGEKNRYAVTNVLLSPDNPKLYLERTFVPRMGHCLFEPRDMIMHLFYNTGSIFR